MRHIAAFFLLLPVLAGAQWTQVPISSGANFESFDFIGNTGLMNGGGVWKTTDGGATWTQKLTGFTRDVDMASLNTAYCAGVSSQAMWVSTNGGEDWTELTPPNSNSLWGVSSPVDGTAWFVGTGSVVWRTDLFGADITVQNPPNMGADAHDVCFVSDQVGYVLIETSYIWKTIDGGENWTTSYDGSGSLLQSIYFPTPAVGFAVGSGGRIVRTTDAGANWTELNTGTTEYWQYVHFFDAQNGMVAAYSGKVYRTVNGGDTWFQEPQFTTTRMNSVYMFSPTSAIVAGEAGEIWRNTNMVVGIAEVPAAPLLGVHPVPSSGVVILEVPNDVRAMSGTVQVIDLHGREVLSAPVGSGRNWTFDIGSLVPGCYAGRVVLADGRVYRVRLQRD